MKGGGGVTRGYLRPGFSRSPPVLMAGLLIIAGISAFNYWNLSAQYGDLVKEIAELQDHIRIATLKRENAEKRIDALQQRLRESEDQLGHLKITADERTRELAEALKAKQFHSKESESLRSQLRSVSETLKNQSTLHEELVSHKNELEKWKYQNAILTEKNSVLQLSLSDTKAQLAAEISQHQQAGWKVPPIRQIGRIKTESEQKVSNISSEKESKITTKTSTNTIKEDFEEPQDGQPDVRDKYNEIDLNLEGQELAGNVAKVRDFPIGVDQLEEDDGANDGNDRVAAAVKGNSSLVASNASSNKETQTTFPNRNAERVKTTTTKPNNRPVVISLYDSNKLTTKTTTQVQNEGREIGINRGDSSAVATNSRVITAKPGLNSTNIIRSIVEKSHSAAKEVIPVRETTAVPLTRSAIGSVVNNKSANEVSGLATSQAKVVGSEKPSVTTTEQSFDIDNHIHNQEMEHFQI